jgi:hypothetical protein
MCNVLNKIKDHVVLHTKSLATDYNRLLYTLRYLASEC